MEPIRHLYFHIPFCPKLCPYCCFYVEVGSKNKTPAFIDALLGEVDRARERWAIEPRTIYFGGGTPSALLTDQLARLLEGLQSRFDVSKLEEFTLEANPATIRPEKAKVLKAGGVTRLSLGVQSWDDDLLKTLGRVHDAAQAERTIDTIREVGIPQLGIDLMFSVPGQSLEQWMATLEKTVCFLPEHISTYCLTYEEDTEYFRKLTGGEYVQDEERDACLFERTVEHLQEAGWQHYEISNYARPGFQSRHNSAYWKGADYLGIGPGAFSTVGTMRWENVRDTSGYTAAIGRGESVMGFSETLSPEMRRSEVAAFGIRTAEGLSASEVEPWREKVEHFLEIGLLKQEGGRLFLTGRGKLLADAVAEAFV